MCPPNVVLDKKRVLLFSHQVSYRFEFESRAKGYLVAVVGGGAALHVIGPITSVLAIQVPSGQTRFIPYITICSV